MNEGYAHFELRSIFNTDTKVPFHFIPETRSTLSWSQLRYKLYTVNIPNTGLVGYSKHPKAEPCPAFGFDVRPVPIIR